MNGLLRRMEKRLDRILGSTVKTPSVTVKQKEIATLIDQKERWRALASPEFEENWTKFHIFSTDYEIRIRYDSNDTYSFRIYDTDEEEVYSTESDLDWSTILKRIEASLVRFRAGTARRP